MTDRLKTDPVMPIVSESLYKPPRAIKNRNSVFCPGFFKKEKVLSV